MSRICARCGYELHEDDFLCPKCGAIYGEPLLVIPSRPEPKPKTQEPEQPVKKQLPHWWPAALAVVVLLLIGIGLLVGLTGKEPEPTS